MQRQLVFKDKRLYINKKTYGEHIRLGQCSKCGRKIGNDVKQTHIHHIEYYEGDPMKGTIELCASCHFKESWRLGSYKNRPKMLRDKQGRFIHKNNSR